MLDWVFSLLYFLSIAHGPEPMEIQVFRYQLIEFATGDPEGVPYRYIGRALMRMWELNLYEGARRYSIKPIRSRE